MPFSGVPFGPRSFLGRRAFLRTLGSLPFSIPLLPAPTHGQAANVFQVGWNHPWIGYGHDFGPAWGHDGLSTSGWTYETYENTRGFTNTQVVRDPETGRGLLRVNANVLGKHPNRASGEVHVSLIDHWPFPCPGPETPTSLDLDGTLVRCRIRLPPGSSGAASAPNGLQLVFKTRLNDEQWPSLYTPWENITPSQEGRDFDLIARVSVTGAAHVDPGFDASAVHLIGMKLGVNANSSAAVSGSIYIDDFALQTEPSLTFDFEQVQLERDVRAVQEQVGQAFSLVRVFVFCDGRASPRFAEDGRVTGLDESFYRDFDALVDIADRTRIRLMPVLLDFHWCAQAKTVSGVRLGGHADIIRNTALRQTFLDQALRPLLERYSGRDSIFAWDLMNEPEWIVDGLANEFPEGFDFVTLTQIREFIAASALYVRRIAPSHLVTVGSARRKWLPLWTGLGLDLYQFHWYDKFEPEEPFPWRQYGELGLDRPCLVGEVPTASTRYTPAQFIRAAQEGGYSGVLLWSYRGRDAFSNFCHP